MATSGFFFRVTPQLGVIPVPIMSIGNCL
uniref:Uncharacterized protein n=1 Tax=Anguilla anguilla TaxID=7936 RepID=A0A0E9XBI1_ANGAN